jgi:RNA polymerase sigma-70 factor, ECF subfamily
VQPEREIEGTEVAIRTALARGAAAAAGAIVRGYGTELLGYLVAGARDREVGEELFQELSKELLRSLPRFRGDSSFRTFSYAIAWNLVRQYRRATARRKLKPLDEELAQRIPLPDRTETKSWQRTAAKNRIAQLRDKLSPEDQTLLFLRVERAMSWKEVARVLENDESAATVTALRKRHERLLRKLRSWIRDDP